MIKTFDLARNIPCYYDLENKTISRFPTNSNLLYHGSDNSLYFGMVNNKETCNVFCSLLEVRRIENITNKQFSMKCGNEMVIVTCNINAQGQIQIKIPKDGVIRHLADTFSYHEMVDYDFTKMLVVIDFKNREIRFRDPADLVL